MTTLNPDESANQFEVEASVVGGFGVSYERVPLAKHRFTWPFGRLDVGNDGLRLRPRRAIRRAMNPITIRYADIDHADVKLGRLIWGISFAGSRKELRGLGFAGFRSAESDRVLRALKEKGVRLQVTGKRLD